MASEAEFETLLAAWRAFMATGRLEGRAIRPELAASWRRCRAAGLDPKAPKPPVKLAQAALAATRARNRLFIEAALPFMRFLETAVEGTGFILVLTDAQGVVLDAFGDDAILAMARENNYVPGCSRAEREVGTNAIGLALTEAKPIQLTGPEHYNVRHHRWTCASAPVFDPEGAILGTVTLSGESIGAHRHTFGLVISAAQAIGDRLRERATQIEKGRVDALLASILKSVSEALVTVDREARITNLNPRAADLLGAKAQAFEGKSLAALFPNNPELLAQLRGGREAQPIEVSQDGAKGRAYFIVTPYLLAGDEGPQGAILAIGPRRDFFATVRDISGFNAVFTFDDIQGAAPALMRPIELARITARQNSRVLIAGETGTGKELFAQAIHNASPRKNGPFVAINCAAIPRDLLESELFGYRGGAFSGARKGGQVGKLELADGGTIFLDEISQMPLDLQAKLLRVLEDGLITRLGDTKPVKADLRVIAATNENLFEKSRQGGFRQDLYYRLSVVEVGLPPLRDRTGDLPILAQHILGRLAKKLDKPGLTLAPAAMAALARYDWPGNIRELENVLEMAAIVSEAGPIEPQHLVARIAAGAIDGAKGRAAAGAQIQPMREVEIDILRATMKEFRGNIALVSRKLGLSRSTIYRRMKEHGISRSVRID
jgi:transcriptional regulator of acetoin/glycerol metabolism